MDVYLIKEPRAEKEKVTVERGSSAEDLYKRYKDQLPYTVLAVKVNNKIEALEYRFYKECCVEFIDMRAQNGNLIYQNSLILIYLKAVEDIVGKADVDIENALNKGLYTEIKTKEPLTAKQIKTIERRMKELVKADLPFTREELAKDEAVARFHDMGCPEKEALLGENPRMKKVPFYSFDGYKDFFYGLMVPSSGYIQHFELRKYRRGVLLRFPHPQDPNKIPEYVDEKVLYKTFGEQSRWGKLMGITYVSDLNRQIEEGKIKELIQLSEALHERRIVEIADMITKNKKRIILIAGPSSSGKTTFAQRLCIQLRVNGLVPLYMGTDDYFVEREQAPVDEFGKFNFEDLDAVDVDLFNEQMNGLLAGETVDMPVFDFVKGSKRYGTRITRAEEDQPIVIEGIHALNDKLTEDIPEEEKYRIYISPLTTLNIDDNNRIPVSDLRLVRRIARDIRSRGRTASQTLSEWVKVRAGEVKNIFPYSVEADVFFNSAFMYEWAMLKPVIKDSLEEIREEDENYLEAERLLRILRCVRSLKNSEDISNNSIMREFIGGGIWVK